MRLSLILALCLVLGFQHLAAQNDAIAERCASLAARGDVAMLREIYDVNRDSLPKNTELYCRFAFARGRGDNRAISAFVDTLEAQYVDDLDLRGLLALCDMKCEALRQIGAYGELADYCRQRLDWCAKRTIKQSRQVNLKFYQQIAQRFIDRPCVAEVWNDDHFFVPVSRDWPLLVPACIGSNEAMPFLVSTAQQTSFISRDDAAECGITSLDEPLQLVTTRGTIAASPVVVDSFSIGALTLRNVMLFVVDESVPAPYNRCIGNDILRHLQQIEVNDQQMLVRRMDGRRVKTPGVPMCFSARGGLDIQQPVDSGYVRYSLDMAEREDFEAEGNRVLSAEYLKQAESLVLDFHNMTYVASPLRQYAPRPVADYLATEDYFNLLRNEASLYFTASEDELAQIDAALTAALTPPDLSSLPRALRAACIRPEQAASLTTSSRQLLVTSRGLIFEKIEGKTRRTILLTEQNIGRHKIDLTNLKVY